LFLKGIFIFKQYITFKCFRSVSKPIRIASTRECECVSLEKEKRIGVVHAINIMPTAQPTDILMAI